ncbi:Inner membrane protein YabI [Salinisphaera shabanensis E1L3A]|uniref:Inner membrane protein YabI n=1 Tax=Salinisphaera shabanensis E1L3A TaxID=1033802 RepID=U2E7I1_9GAMM|nr:VTT domain-containing protein [Salinisphaera shabanensis]ERJ19696.1 Inner membrane protein YabI [Salinisphaera shabanensis E1L3A]
MGHDLFAALLAWVDAHPLAALALVFAIALGESLFLFGLLVPGALFMFAFGALIGANLLPIGATFVAAIIGTLIGDGASFVLGRRYRGHVSSLPGFARAPVLVARGERFLADHGGKAIIMGRLIGALRPIMPTVAGAAGLSTTRFVIMDLIATAIWAPCYILPGVVFGASLDLAAQVATRLAILLVAVVAIVWITTVSVRFVLVAGRVALHRYAGRLLAWSRRHRRLGLLGPALADPRQPEIPALAVGAGLLMLATALAYLVMWGWQRPVYPGHFDALAFYIVQSLQTPISDQIAFAIAQMGSPLIYLPFAVVLAAVLAVMGNWRAATHWMVALGFSALVALGLRWWLAIPAPSGYFHGDATDPLFLAGGGQDLILCATVYGMAGLMIAAGQPLTARPYYHSITVAGVVLIALARLYLGLDWASDLLIGLAIAFVWLNMLVLSYRRQRPARVHGAPVLAVLAGFAMVAVVAGILPDTTYRAWAQAEAKRTPSIIDHWADHGYRELDTRIKDIAGRASAPLNVQAAAHAPQLKQMLAEAGWHPAPALGVSQPLHWLVSDSDIRQLAVLPRIHDGRQPTLTLVHAVAPPEAEHMRRVLRLWPTGQVRASDRSPLWVGMTDVQKIAHRFHLLATAADQRQYPAAQAALVADLKAAGVDLRLVENDRGSIVLINAPQATGDAKVAPDPRRGHRR